MTRKELQEKILAIKALYSGEDRAYWETQIATWLDSKDLANVAFTQEEMKQRLMDDLSSYQWEEEE